MNLNELNPSQLAAVTYNEGPSLVIAGAGSGKTRVLTYKIAYLLEKGLRASNILALTFTNKAAREMKNRIVELVGDREARYLWMGTFHSIAARLLRQDAEKLGFTNDFTIYDTDDTNRVIKDIIRTLNLNDKQYKYQVVRSRISMAKNHLIGPHAYASSEWVREDTRNRLPEIYQIYHIYWQRLNESNAMDFDDLLVNFYRLIDQHTDVCQKWQSLFQYILVDEYQDTNYVQYMLVKKLAAPQNLVCVVGDDAQSIYSFRGANIGNILSFQKEYMNARLFKLERNYRSTQTIVKAANSLIEWNKEQIRKNIYSEKEVGSYISVSCHLTDRDEAEWVINQILLLRRRETKDWGNFVILYRTNAQSRVLEDACRKYQIPYRIYGSVSFYQRKEIKDALAYIRLSLNEKDNDAFLRIINVPARGIGDTSQKKIVQAALDAEINLLKVANEPENYAVGISAATQKKLQTFAQLIASFANESEKLTAFEYTKKVLNESGILASALADTTPEGQDRYQNLQELLSSIHEAESTHLNETGEQFKIRDFMASVALITDQDQQANDTTPHISLMTVHTAKGLEFPVVFVAGLEETLFPSSMAMTPREVEEERRLLYVAITRAEEQCFLTYARQRFRNGQVTVQNISRFIEEISDKYLDRKDKREKPQTWRRSIGNYFESATPQDFRSSRGQELKRLGVRIQDTTETKVSPIEGGDYPIGTRVYHRVFGAGTVLKTYRENDNEKIDIQFDTAGKKTLLLQFAKLTKV